MDQWRRKVALAVDDSNHSVNAFQWYLHKLHRPGDYVILMHCVETIAPFTGILPVSTHEMYDRLDKWHLEKAGHIIQNLSKSLYDRGIPFEPALVHDNPKHGLYESRNINPAFL